jgi:4,5-DOPA dioxygenase extradiol
VSPLPSVFISHGSPMHALQPGAAGKAWAALGERLRPRALLIASAHWETTLPTLTAGTRPETLHDFYGFPDALYRLRYAASGAPEVARRAQALLAEAGFTAALDGCRGLDHGAWAPLLHAYPRADVPVVQLSVQPALGARHHLALGQALRPLLDEGVLVVGSGHMTHNLGDWQRGAADPAPMPYVEAFRKWVDEALGKRDFERLADYRSQAPHAVRAHPTEEHFLPLFIALGAARGAAAPQRLVDYVEGGALAMDAYAFH